mmetsp:Transcript_129117/g.237571  ORF Transcript_129117/g.237571 Transcript_129117/m.237571 type:complete len:97 (-) Transcript_129117:90-380(-)
MATRHWMINKFLPTLSKMMGDFHCHVLWGRKHLIHGWWEAEVRDTGMKRLATTTWAESLECGTKRAMTNQAMFHLRSSEKWMIFTAGLGEHKQEWE